jgi:hypothetical protein
VAAGRSGRVTIVVLALLVAANLVGLAGSAEPTNLFSCLVGDATTHDRMCARRDGGAAAPADPQEAAGDTQTLPPPGVVAGMSRHSLLAVYYRELGRLAPDAQFVFYSRSPYIWGLSPLLVLRMAGTDDIVVLDSADVFELVRARERLDGVARQGGWVFDPSGDGQTLHVRLGEQTPQQLVLFGVGVDIYVVDAAVIPDDLRPANLPAGPAVRTAP